MKRKKNEILDEKERNQKESADDLLIRIFRNILPEYKMNYRKEQLELSREMLKALQRNNMVLCEAGVGTGKTHAYIMAITVYNLFSMYKLPAVISTSTVALQKALTEEYIPQISSILMAEHIIDRPLTYVVRKGKSHFACDSRLTDYMMSLIHHNDPEEREIITLLSELRDGVRSIDLDTVPVSDYVKERICVEQCHLHCGFSAMCQYKRYTRKCRVCSYDFQIANHNFVLADTLNIKNGKSRLLPAYGVAVFDEAHKIIEAARQMYGVCLEEQELNRLAVSIHRSVGNHHPDRRNIRKLCNDMVDHKQKLFELICNENEERYENGSFPVVYTYEMIQRLRALTKLLQKLSVLFFTADKAKQDYYERLVSRIDEKLEKVSVLLNKNDFIFWAETSSNGLVLWGIPKMLGEELKNDLWNKGIAYILTSATMSVGGDFSHFIRNTGIPNGLRKISGISVESPFDYERHCLLYIPKEMPFPDYKDDDYLLGVVGEIEALLYQTHGHTLILFTSYRMMERTFFEVKKRVSRFPMFSMIRGRLSSVSDFRKSGNGVLFASDSAGEGIDLPGDILSSVIIVKLPFPVPDAVSEQASLNYGSRKQYQRDEVIPAMLIKLRQWVGRGVRKEDDTTVFSILDSRVGACGRYRKDVLAVLPNMPVTEDIEDVGRFIRENKSEEYFE